MARWNLRLFRRGALLAVVGLSIGSGTLFAQSAKPRKWKDASGKFEIEATFVKEANGVVTLKQTDGEEVEIELKQLSPADEAYVKAEMASKGANPFKPRSSSSSSSTKPDAAAPVASGPAPTAVETDWSSAALISGPGGHWKPVTIETTPVKKPKSSQLPAKRDIFERFTGMATGDGFAILGYAQPDSPPRPDAGTTRLVRVNLETGKVEGSIIVQGAYALMDVSRNGEEIVMRKEGEHMQPGSELEIWKPAGKTIERLKAFAPFASEQHQKQVQTALLGANGRMLVIGNSARGGIFSISDGQPLSTALKVHGACLSPDRRFAAIQSESLLIVDMGSGDAVAELPYDKTFGTCLAFSPDGKRIAAGSGSDLTAWDLDTGKVYRTEVVAGVSAVQSLPFLWTSPTHLLVGMTLVDLENHLALWTYTGADKATNYGTATLIAADRSGGGGALVASELPHEAAKAALKQALRSPNLFAVKPGTAVSIDVSGVPDAAEQQKAKQALEAALLAAGLKPAQGGPVTLRASITSTSKDEEYRVLGRGLGTTTVNVTRYTSKVELVAGGQTAWEVAAGGGPAFHVRPMANESLEDAIRNSSKPNYSFFSNVSIPQYVMAPGKKTLGSSSVLN